MSRQVEHAAEWIYRGLWGVLASWFKVPQDPPALPVGPGETLRTFKPSPQFLAYRKFYFWVVLTIVDVLLTVAWVAVLVVAPLVGALLFPVYVAVAVFPDIIAYVAIHLRYDTMWYVLSDRSMRLRRGIWIIHETTITYENIQNISIRQGPVQRWFGIASLTVHTAGGGGTHAGKGADAGTADGHVGIIEGITDASEVRHQLMERVERSRSAGLGDEHRFHGAPPSSPGSEFVLTHEHVEVLREIRRLLAPSPEHTAGWHG